MAQDALDMIEYRDDPPILVFGAPATIARARRSAEAAGWRVLAAEPVAAAAGRIARARAAPIFLDLEEERGPPDPALPALLDRMQIEAEAGRPGVVAAPPALIDLVAARAHHPAIAHLCRANELERVTALRLAAPRPERLHDIGREGEGLVQHALLHQLSEEVGRIAGILASLSDEDEAAPERARALADEDQEPPIDAARIRAIIRARRLRDQYFRGDLFADPAWDMLLDLMAARIERNRVAVSSLCIAAAVPATTALRWIKALTERGIFLRSADPRDGRRVFIELSDEAARAMAAYLRAAQRIAPAAI